MKRPSYLLLLFFVAFTAVSMMVSCHGERTIENERSEEEIMRLKRVGDSVDVLASTSRAMVDSALAASPDSVTYYDYLVELARWSLVQVPDSAMGHINRIMSFARRQERTPRINGLLAEAFHLRANFFFLYHQNQEKALEDNLEAYRLFMVSDMQDNVTSICANIGDVYMQQSLLPEAASWYRRALVLTDSLQLPTSNNSSFFMGLGRIYCLLQDYEKSEEYYHKSLADFDQMHVNMRIYLLNNYGNLKYYKHDYDAALRVFERLDSLIVQHQLIGGFEDYLCKLNMADVYLNLGRTNESMACLHPADSFFRANGVGDAIYYANTIRIGNALKKGNTAIIGNILANEPTELTHDENMIDIRNRYLYDYYMDINDARRAAKYQQIYTRRKDSIDNSREHMRSSDIMMRLAVDTLTLHNELRLKEKDAQMSRYTLFFTIAIAIVMMLALALLAWSLFLRKRNADKQLEIVNLRIDNSRSRLSPHFIFNVLKHAAFGEGSEAGKVVTNIIHLMHAQLTMARQMYATLEDELQFTSTYVEVAATTLGDGFSYEVVKPEEDYLKQRMVPSTFVQILVENAIKHGLSGKEGVKLLKVEATVTSETTQVSVTDNGRGFDIRRPSQNRGTGTGLSVIRRTIALYNEHHRQKIGFTIKNPTDAEGNIKGCCFTLILPAALGRDED